MSKMITALKLFYEKRPATPVQSIEQYWHTNSFLVTTVAGDKYNVDIGHNSIASAYSDPDWDD